MDIGIYISISVLCVILITLLGFLAKSRRAKTATPPPAAVNAQRGAGAARGQAAARQQPAARGEGLPRRREPRRRMVREAQEDYDSDEDMVYEEEGSADIFDMIDQPDGKIGAKKMRKLQEKAEKRQNREMVEQERVEKKQREAEREHLRKVEDDKRKEEEAADAEEERLKKEEEEKKEYEEYLKLKEMFSVDEEGEADLEADLESGSLLQEFISYVKDMKVVLLEDLASHFKIKTQDAVDRIMALQESGDLTGVIDDRGKFIYITLAELESVAKFIRQRGRVAITELAESSNQLINLNPFNAHITKKLYAHVSS